MRKVMDVIYNEVQKVLHFANSTNSDAELFFFFCKFISLFIIFTKMENTISELQAAAQISLDEVRKFLRRFESM